MTVAITPPTVRAHDRLLHVITLRAHDRADRVCRLLDVDDEASPDEIRVALDDLMTWFGTYQAAHNGAAGERLTVPSAMAREIAGLGIEVTRTTISDGGERCNYLEEGEALVFFCNIAVLAAAEEVTA